MSIQRLKESVEMGLPVTGYALVERLVGLAQEGPGRLGWALPAGCRGNVLGWWDGLEEGEDRTSVDGPAMELARHDGHGWLLTERMPGLRGLVFRGTTPEYMASSFWTPLREIAQYMLEDAPEAYAESRCVDCGALFSHDEVVPRRVEGEFRFYAVGRCEVARQDYHEVLDRPESEIQAVQRVAGLLSREDLARWTARQ